jgi:hypothetical protein
MIRMLALLPLIFCLNVQVGAQNPSVEDIVFEGIVERIAPDSGVVSGNLAVYRLSQYRVRQVCKGRYRGSRIVVDHLILTGKELEEIKVGDQVCVSVKRSNKILARFNSNGIRRPTERVNIFYIAGKVDVTSISDCRCCEN